MFVAAMLAAIFGTGAVAAVSYRHDLIAAIEKWQRGPIPPTVTLEEITTKEKITENREKNGVRHPAVGGESGTEPPQPLPISFNLAVPFVLQAPFAVWDEVHEDACEEASIAMLKAFVDSRKAPLSKEEMETMILAIVEYENRTLGYNKDTSAEETAKIMRELYGLNAKALTLRSLDDIKRRIILGRPVILPAYGKALQNPFFKNGGPVYHMLVAKGWTATHIITNDPGTKHGADFSYPNDILWNAIRDWNGGDVPNGAKVMIAAE